MNDWQKICLEIRSNYKSLHTVGREIGSDERHLNRLARGEVKEPKHSVGEKLLKLHETYCG